MDNKDRPPITDYQMFFRALRGVVTVHGYKFKTLYDTDSLVPNNEGKGWVRIGPIYWRSPQTSLWCPFSVIHYVYFRSSDKTWLPGITAAERIGLSAEMYRELSLAQHEERGHLTELRYRMLKACGLVEVPHSQRHLSKELVQCLTKQRAQPSIAPN